MNSTDELLELLLKNRGITKEDQKKAYLEPNFETNIYDPFLLQDMQVAVDRILLAIEKKEKIVIYGDYDCDGIPGSVVLYDFFSEIGYTHFSNYIPHRHTEGYGLHVSAIEKFAKEGVTLLITVDLGITNIAEVAYAHTLGIDTIITDHHLPHEEIDSGAQVQVLPKAVAVINAKRTGNQYPDNMLCGCATAWKLVCALITTGKERNINVFAEIPVGFEKWLLDMVGISTISDMVPLQNENRVLAYYGLIVLRKNRRKGVRALLLNANLRPDFLTEEDVGFSIAPRINAASRMDIPMDAFDVLSTRDEATAIHKANYLESLNTGRKENVAVYMKKAHELAKLRTDKKILVVGDKEWSPGVLGLIAGKLTDAYGKTTFVWGGGEDGSIKGSCRSDGNTHLVDLMSAVEKETFTAMGGHELAGGFSLELDKLFDLEERIQVAYEKVKHMQLEKKNELYIDCALRLSDVTVQTFNTITKLAPFGLGNQKPLFSFDNVKIIHARLFGKTKNHLELIVSKDNTEIKAIQFFAGTHVETKSGLQVELVAGMSITLFAYIEKNTFAGAREIRLRIHAIKLEIVE
jgi:single-stranded-DNA-specific exonuclease